MEIVILRNVDDILRLYPEASKERLEKIKADVMEDLEKAEKGERIVFGAKFEDGIVGTVQLVFRDTKDHYADGVSRVHIHHTRVAEGLRGTGIGSALMQHVEQEAKQRGFKEITLGVEETNEKALRFYQQLGYCEFMREKGDEGEVIIGMKKELSFFEYIKSYSLICANR